MSSAGGEFSSFRLISVLPQKAKKRNKSTFRLAACSSKVTEMFQALLRLFLGFQVCIRQQSHVVITESNDMLSPSPMRPFFLSVLETSRSSPSLLGINRVR